MMITKEYLHKLQATGNDEYFQAAENDAMLYFREYLQPHMRALNDKVVLEVACGHGRMTNQLLKKYSPKEMILVDINVDNIFFCENRFKKRPEHFRFIKNDGESLKEIADNSVDFAFSFDSMVHFNFDLMMKYVAEIRRVLKDGGRALIHYSNCQDVTGQEFGPGLRGAMTNGLMLSAIPEYKVIHNEIIDWGGVKNLDAIIVFEK